MLSLFFSKAEESSRSGKKLMCAGSFASFRSCTMLSVRMQVGDEDLAWSGSQVECRVESPPVPRPVTNVFDLLEFF